MRVARGGPGGATTWTGRAVDGERHSMARISRAVGPCLGRRQEGGRVGPSTLSEGLPRKEDASDPSRVAALRSGHFRQRVPDGRTLRQLVKFVCRPCLDEMKNRLGPEGEARERAEAENSTRPCGNSNRTNCNPGPGTMYG